MSLFVKPAWAVNARTGPCRNFLKLKIFACEGQIVMYDERPDQEKTYTVLTPATMEERVKALSRPYRGQGRMDIPAWKRQEYDEEQRGYQNCVEVIKEARAMGDPSDPAVQAFWARHRRSSTVKMNFGPLDSSADAAKLPPLTSSGILRGRGADLPIADVSSVPTIYTPPARRRVPNSSILLPTD